MKQSMRNKQVVIELISKLKFLLPVLNLTLYINFFNESKNRHK